MRIGASNKLSHEERLFFNAATNPFGDGSAAVQGARIPDGSGGITVPMTLSSTTHLVGSSGTEFVAKLCAPRKYGASTYIIGQVAYSSGGAASPTAVLQYLSPAFDAVASMVESIRVVGGGIRANVVSEGDDNHGDLYGGMAPTAVWDYNGGGAAVFPTYITFARQKEGPFYKATDGITVRHIPTGPSALQYDSSFSVATDTPTLGDTCFCAFASGLADTDWRITMIIHLEARIIPDSTPFAVSQSPVSSRFDNLWSVTNALEINPLTSKGRSFRKWLEKATPAILRFITGQIPTLADAIGYGKYGSAAVNAFSALL